MRARRWAAWARQFKERHERVGRRYSPAMVLVRFRGGRPVQRIWRPRVWVTVQPQSNLQVNVLSVTRAETREFHLHQQLLKPAPVLERSATAAAPVRIPREIPKVVCAVRRESLMPLPRMEQRCGVADPGRSSQVVMARPNAGWSWVESRMVTESIARQVIRRSERVEEFVRTLRKGTAIAVEPESPARRVLRGNARREEMPQPAAMSLRPAPAVAPQPEPRKQVEDESVGERQAVPSTPPMSTLNIDLVTRQVMDQIDRRVIAWRERMGKF